MMASMTDIDSLAGMYCQTCGFSSKIFGEKPQDEGLPRRRRQRLRHQCSTADSTGCSRSMRATLCSSVLSSHALCALSLTCQVAPAASPTGQCDVCVRRQPSCFFSLSGLHAAILETYASLVAAASTAASFTRRQLAMSSSGSSARFVIRPMGNAPLDQIAACSPLAHPLAPTSAPPSLCCAPLPCWP